MMLGSKLARHGSSGVATTAHRTLLLRHGGRVASAASAASSVNDSVNSHSTRFISSETEKNYQELGYLDERGLTNFDTLHEMQYRSCQVFAENELFGTYNPSTEKFEFDTYETYGTQVEQCRALLQDLGIKEYDKVAIISNNRWEWAAIAAASYSLNASVVPMYEAQLPADWTYIINDSGARALFCATQDIYDRVQKEVLPSAPTIQATLCLDGPEGESHTFATAMSNSAPDSDGKYIIQPTQEDLANLIYTSGTTGM